MISGFIITLKHLLKQNITEEYPEIKPRLNKNFRGKHKLVNCIGCKTCRKVCPGNAITITQETYKIDYKKCIFCGNCVYYCPVNAITMTSEFELATDNKNELINDLIK